MSGIEPSSSLMITIMLLEDDANRLVSSSPESLAVLSDMFVNYVMDGEMVISVSGIFKYQFIFLGIVIHCHPEKRCLVKMIRPRDHKLRKYLILKLDFEYLKFHWIHCFNNLQI